MTRATFITRLLGRDQDQDQGWGWDPDELHEMSLAIAHEEEYIPRAPVRGRAPWDDAPRPVPGAGELSPGYNSHQPSRYQETAAMVDSPAPSDTPGRSGPPAPAAAAGGPATHSAPCPGSPSTVGEEAPGAVLTPPAVPGSLATQLANLATKHRDLNQQAANLAGEIRELPPAEYQELIGAITYRDDTSFTAAAAELPTSAPRQWLYEIDAGV